MNHSMNHREGEDVAAKRAADAAVEQMPVLKDLVASLKGDGFTFAANTLLFGVQHLMNQSLALCWALNELGLSYDRIALAGKPYSTDPSVVNHLSNLGVMVQSPREYSLARAHSQEQLEDIRRLAARFGERMSQLSDPAVLILDDGGNALAHFTEFVSSPCRLMGVEQTASGFWQPAFHTISFPIVDVGASAVKRICEPRMIAEAAIERVARFLSTKMDGRKIGVVGRGYIGTALQTALTERGHHTISFDIRNNNSLCVESSTVQTLWELFDESDIIFGCTGVDITRGILLDDSRFLSRTSEKLLISLSSGDDEFFSLKHEFLSQISEDKTYRLGRIPDVKGQRWGAPFTIVRNGFPINFDNTGESVPLDSIQGTIAALVGAACQAAITSRKNTSHVPTGMQRIMLDTQLQRWLFRKWRPYLSGMASTEQTQMDDMSAIVQLSRERTIPHSVELESAFGEWTEDKL